MKLLDNHHIDPYSIMAYKVLNFYYEREILGEKHNIGSLHKNNICAHSHGIRILELLTRHDLIVQKVEGRSKITYLTSKGRELAKQLTDVYELLYRK